MIDRNELVKLAAQAIADAASYTPGWDKEAAAAVDAILPVVVEQVREEAAQIALCTNAFGLSGPRVRIDIADAIRGAVLGDVLKGGKANG